MLNSMALFLSANRLRTKQNVYAEGATRLRTMSYTSNGCQCLIGGVGGAVGNQTREPLRSILRSAGERKL